MSSVQFVQYDPNTQVGGQQQQSSTKGLESIFEMMGLILEVMQDFANENADSTQVQQKMGNLMLDALNSQYDKEEKELKEEQEAEKKSHTFWGKIDNFFKGVADALGDLVKAGADLVAGDISGAKASWKDLESNPELANIIKAVMYVVAAVTVVVGVITQNYELVAVTVALVALTQSGLLNDIESHIGSAGGKLAFDIIVVVAITALTAGAGAASAVESVADEAGEEAGEVATNSVENGAKEVGEETAQNVGEDVEEGSEGSKTTFNTSKAVGMGLMGFGSSLGSVNLAQDLVGVLDPKGKHKDELEMILSLVQAVVAVAASLGGGVASTTGATSGGTSAISDAVGNLTTRLQELLPNVTEFLSNNFSSVGEYIDNNLASITSALQKVQSAGNLIGGGAEGLQASNSFRIAGIEKDAAKINGMIEKFSAALKENQDGLQNTNQYFQNAINGYNQIIQNVLGTFQGYQNAAELI